MIRVTNEFHYINPDVKLNQRWQLLLIKAAAAYALGDKASYEKIYQTVRSEFAKWKSSANRYCEQKSHKNWLGGGETYIVAASDPTERMDTYHVIFRDRSSHEIIKTLMEIEKDPMRYVSPI